MNLIIPWICVTLVLRYVCVYMHACVDSIHISIKQWPVFVHLFLLYNYCLYISQGPLEQFIHSMEPQLRQLGLPTTLKKGLVHFFFHYLCHIIGVIVLLSDHIVCKKGDTLTPEQARLLVSVCYSSW